MLNGALTVSHGNGGWGWHISLSGFPDGLDPGVSEESCVRSAKWIADKAGIKIVSQKLVLERTADQKNNPKDY